MFDHENNIFPEAIGISRERTTFWALRIKAMLLLGVRASEVVEVIFSEENPSREDCIIIGGIIYMYKTTKDENIISDN